MTRFIAISLRSYQTWQMRMTLTLVLLTALALLPLRSEAFDLEQALREQHVQYQGEPDIRVAQGNCTSLSQAIEQVQPTKGHEAVAGQRTAYGVHDITAKACLLPKPRRRRVWPVLHVAFGCRGN